MLVDFKPKSIICNALSSDVAHSAFVMPSSELEKDAPLADALDTCAPPFVATSRIASPSQVSSCFVFAAEIAPYLRRVLINAVEIAIMKRHHFNAKSPPYSGGLGV